MSREFNIKAYSKYDMAAKRASVQLMKVKGYELNGSLNDEHYKKFDLVFTHSNGNVITVENEYRPSFNTIKNVYDTVHIPIRKANTQCDFYFVWGNDFNEVGIIEKKDILNFKKKVVEVVCQSEVGEKETKPFVEAFIDIPKESVMFYKKNSFGRWKKN